MPPTCLSEWVFLFISVLLCLSTGSTKNAPDLRKLADQGRDQVFTWGLRREVLEVGLLFEQFILELVKGLGVEVDDVVTGAKLRSGPVALQEVDVVVNSGGRLHVIDCKLNSEHEVPIGTQIREAFATRKHLGDGSDQFILLRPNQEISREFQSLAHMLQIQVLDRNDLDEDLLPNLLKRLLDTPDSEVGELPVLDELVSPDTAEQEGYVGFDGIKHFSGSELEKEFFSFDGLIVIMLRANASSDLVRKTVGNRLDGLTSGIRVFKGGNSKTRWTVSVLAPRVKHQEIRNRLAQIAW